MKKLLLVLATVMLLASSVLGGCSSDSSSTDSSTTETQDSDEVKVTEEMVSIGDSSTTESESAGEETDEPKTITVTDSTGRVVELPYPIDKAIITYSQLLLTAKALKVDDENIIALDEFTYGQYKDIFKGLNGTPTVGKNLFNLDVEKIISLEPQVIISTSSTLTRNADLEAQLDKVGIKFVGLDFDLENVESIIETLGLIFGKEKRAKEYSEFWFGALDAVQEKVGGLSDEEKVKVYWENTAAGYVTISSQSSAHEIVELAGGYNIGRDLEGKSPEVDPEWVITQNPDVIMHYPMGADFQGGFGTTDKDNFAAIKAELIARPGFEEIKAVQEDEVYICSQIIKTGAFENIAICYIAKILYPDLFADMNPLKLMRDMVEQYLNLNWDEMDGVFVYPDPLKE